MLTFGLAVAISVVTFVMFFSVLKLFTTLKRSMNWCLCRIYLIVISSCLAALFIIATLC